MKIQLAYRNLIHNRYRTFVAVSGVAFAIILIFMQLGFLGAVRTTATLVYEALDFDLMIRSPAYLHFCDARTFPRARVLEAASVEGVASAKPFYVGLNKWQQPAPQPGVWRSILTMGIDPDDPVFLPTEIRQQARRLVAPEFVLVDRKSRRDYGPANGRRFGEADVGRETTLSLKRVQIVGHFELGTGLAANGAVLTNLQGFERASPVATLEDVSLGLIRVAPGQPPELVLNRLRQQLGHHPDVVVLTRQQVIERELVRWVNETSIGTIFLMGVGVALIVGTAIVFQVLSSDVASLIGEYATLKAMGYSNGYLARVILQQALILAVLGYLPGLALAELFYRITSSAANIPIEMEWGRAAVVLLLSVLMCVLSGLGAVRKVRTADPADLY